MRAETLWVIFISQKMDILAQVEKMPRYKLQTTTSEEDQLARRNAIPSDNVTSEHLRKNADPRTVHDIMVEKGPKATKRMSNLTNVIEVKKRHLEEMESKYMETRETIGKLVTENDKLLQSYYTEVKEMEFSIREHFQWICNDHEMTNLKLERQEKELELRSIEVQKCEFINENERKKLAKEIKENAVKNSLLQNKQKLAKLAEDHKREMKKLDEKVCLLTKELDDGNQGLFLEMKHLVGQLNVMNSKRDDVEAHKKIEDTRMKLNEMEEEIEALESLNQFLVTQERKRNDELKETRKELIEGFKDLPRVRDIGVKRIRELDIEAFYDAVKRKYNGIEAEERAAELRSFWGENLRDPDWYPFKVIGKSQEVVDENDEKLKRIKREMGDEVYRVVMTALTGSCSPNARCAATQLWNFTEARYATLGEGISCLFKMWGAHKRKTYLTF